FCMVYFAYSYQLFYFLCVGSFVQSAAASPQAFYAHGFPEYDIGIYNSRCIFTIYSCGWYGGDLIGDLWSIGGPHDYGPYNFQGCSSGFQMGCSSLCNHANSLYRDVACD